jgi:hypothetical protein
VIAHKPFDLSRQESRMTHRGKCLFKLCSALLISSSSAVVAAPIWNAQYGDTQVGQYAGDIAISSGAPIIVGSFNGDINFGGGPLLSAGETDVYVAKFDGNGGHIWAKRFGDFEQQHGRSIAVGATGRIVVAGDFFGSIDFGGGMLMGQMGGPTVFLAKFDANGSHQWSKAFPGGQAFATALDKHENVLLGGQFSGTIDFGCGPLMSAGNQDIFLAKFSRSTGSCLWSKRFGDNMTQYAAAVAIDSQDNIILGGGFFSSVDFGSGVHVAGNGNESGYVAKFDTDGNLLWDIDSGAASGSMGVRDITVNNMDEILFTGSFSGQITFGGPVMAGAGGIDAYVAALDSQGQHLWSRRFGDAGHQEGRSIAVNELRRVFITGGCTSSMAPAALNCSVGFDDVYTIQLDEFGNYASGNTYGDQAYQSGAAVAVTGKSRFVLGDFRGTLNFGLGAMFAPGASNQDIFLVKFSP